MTVTPLFTAPWGILANKKEAKLAGGAIARGAQIAPANRSAYRYVRGLGAASAAPLPPSGGVAEFTDVAAPARLRVEARIVRLADGMRSLANPDV